MDTPRRSAYPSDVSDEDWVILAPYLTLMRDEAAQRCHPLRDLIQGLRFISRIGLQWRFMPYEFSPWHTIYEQTRCWRRVSLPPSSPICAS